MKNRLSSEMIYDCVKCAVLFQSGTFSKAFTRKAQNEKLFHDEFF